MHALSSSLTFLAQAPVLRLFLVVAGGYLLGERKLPGGIRMGTAAVLFAGMALGALDPRMALPPEMGVLGLSLFVYCMGLEAGPGFFRSLAKDGLKPNLAILGASLAAWAAAWGAGRAFGVERTALAGVFCGALNNTAALGAAAERARAAGHATGLMEAAFALAYPVGVAGAFVWIALRGGRASGPGGQRPATLPRMIRTATIKITREGPRGPWRAGEAAKAAGVLFTRARLDGKVTLIGEDAVLPPGTLAVVVGRPESLLYARELLGENSEEALEDDLTGFVLDRYQVSNPRLAGLRVGELGVESLGAVVSRIRRGDVDLPVTNDTVLQLGDRVRAISYRSSEGAVRAFFGNSLQTLTEMGYMTFAVGIGLGLVLGAVPIPVPGMGALRLGATGGPLIVALILGWRGRSGPFIWNVPFTTNMTLRHFGLIIFLASAGIHAGGALPLVRGLGVGPMLGATLAVVLIGHLTLALALRAMGEADLGRAFGYACALQTQPAALAFAAERADRASLNLAYATVYPMSLISKIVLAQLLGA
ncbi:MAG TPA: TrkA C-terminal domain-containing protein [Elusimicrobiota bacterium]|nr:TrkA C-terminal domain-containing protein [Elusimicrobiota bacterium]